MSMKNSNDAIGNRSRDLPVCSAVSQLLRHHVPPPKNKIGFLSAATLESGMFIFVEATFIVTAPY
jgi:hypothetical protein